MKNENKDTPLTSPDTVQPIQKPTAPAIEGSQEGTTRKDSKIPKVVIYILASIFLVALGASGFWLYQEKVAKPSPNMVIPTSTPSVRPTDISDTTIPNDWKVYRNEEFGFEISYPEIYEASILNLTEKEVGITLTKSNGIKFHIEAIGTGTAYENESFYEYVLHSTSSEIQGYGPLYSIQEFFTESKIKGYKIKWEVTNLQGKKSVSENFYYLPLSKKVSIFSQPVKSVQIWGDTSDEENVDKIAETFKFI